MNALAQRDVAIVSEEAGTTRDVIEVHLDLGGCPVIVTDTAGIREAEGAIEAEGVRRTSARVKDADLVLWMVDAPRRNGSPNPRKSSQTPVHIRVLNKVDLVKSLHIADGVALSAKTGEGVAELVEICPTRAREGLAIGEPAVITRARHRAELEATAVALGRFREEREGRNSRPRNSASPRGISGGSLAASTWKRCSAQSSPSSASANNRH